jgi:hypothetical protein
MLLKSSADLEAKLIQAPEVGCRDHAEDMLPLTILFEVLRDQITPDKVGRVVDIIKLLYESGADVGEAAKRMKVGTVSKLEGYESLWYSIRSRLMAMFEEEKGRGQLVFSPT